MKEYKDFVRTGYNSFCKGTSIHGFAELYSTKNIIWKLIWMMLIGAGLGITVYQVSIATTQYLQQTTIITIQPATAEDLMIPPLRMCYSHWIYWVDWTKATRMGFSKESILYALSSLTNIVSSTNFVETVASKELTVKMSAHKLKTLSALFEAIALKDPYHTKLNFSHILFSNADQGMVKLCHVISGENVQGMLDSSNNRKVNKPRKLAMMQSSSKDLSFNIAKRYFDDLDGNFTRSEFNFYFFQFLVTQSNNDDFTRVSIYTDTMLPVTVYPNGHSTKDYIRVTDKDDVYDITVHLAINKYKSHSKRVACNEEWRWVTTNRTCDLKCFVRYTSYQTAPFELFDAMVIKRDTLDQVNLNYLLYFDEGVESTKANVSNVILSDCKDNGEYDYSEEIENAHAISEYVRCVEECVSVIGCHTYKYSIITTKRNSGFSFSNQTKITIEYPSEKDVLVMTEMDTQSWEGFVGNVGGLLGIWTGASILSFVQMIYLSCCSRQ